jgi:hypothetical protein
MQVECLLAGQTLYVVQTGGTLPEAAQAMLHTLIQQLQATGAQGSGSQRHRIRRGCRATSE